MGTTLTILAKKNFRCLVDILSIESFVVVLSYTSNIKEIKAVPCVAPSNGQVNREPVSHIIKNGELEQIFKV